MSHRGDHAYNPIYITFVTIRTSNHTHIHINLAAVLWLSTWREAFGWPSMTARHTGRCRRSRHSPPRVIVNTNWALTTLTSAVFNEYHLFAKFLNMLVVDSAPINTEPNGVLRGLYLRSCIYSLYFVHLGKLHHRNLDGIIPFHAHSSSTSGKLGSERRSDKLLVFVTAILRGSRSGIPSCPCRPIWTCKVDLGSRSFRSPCASLSMPLQSSFSRISTKCRDDSYLMCVCCDVRSDNPWRVVSAHRALIKALIESLDAWAREMIHSTQRSRWGTGPR